MAFITETLAGDKRIQLGTSAGFPDDTFESYGTGTVISGSTINSGTGW